MECLRQPLRSRVVPDDFAFEALKFVQNLPIGSTFSEEVKQHNVVKLQPLALLYGQSQRIPQKGRDFPFAFLIPNNNDLVAAEFELVRVVD